MLEETETTQ